MSTPSPAVADDAADALSCWPLLANLSLEVRQLVEGCFVPVSYPFGAVMVREGETADAYYVIVEGTVRVLKQTANGQEISLNTLGRGDGFGEAGLLEEGVRSATVRASSDVRAMRLDRSLFLALANQHAELLAELKLHVRHHHLRDLLRMHSVFARLPATTLSQLISQLRPHSVRVGERLFSEGDPPGSLFVVKEGHLRAFQATGDHVVDVAFFRTGDLVGEVDLFAQQARSATVEAVTDADLLELGADAFDQLLNTDEAFRAVIDEHVHSYDYASRANVPLDFSFELLPAAAARDEELVAAPDASGGDQRNVEADAEIDRRFVRPDRPIRRFPHVWQIDQMDCGAACVAMVCRYFGRKISLARVREVVQTGTGGTSLAGIARGIRELGIDSLGAKASKSRLDEMPLPAIVHWEGNHWMVLYATGRKRVKLADPGRGLRSMPREEFLEGWTGFVSYVARTPLLDEQAEEVSDARWIAQFFKPHRRIITIAILLAFVGAALEMAVPMFGKRIVDHVVVGGDHGLLPILVAGMFGAIAIAVLALILQRYLLSYMAVRFDTDSMDFLTARMLALPMSYFNNRRTGDIGRRLQGMSQVRQFIVQNGVQALMAATQLLVALVLMFIYSPFLAVIYYAAAPAYALLMVFSAKRLRPMLDSLETSYGKYQSRQVDAIKGIETVKAMGAEAELRGLMLRQFKDLAHRLFHADFNFMLYEGAIQLVAFVQLAIFLWIGAVEVINHQLTLGGLLAFNSLVLLANSPILIVLAMWDQLQYSSILLNRLNDILCMEPEQGTDRAQLKPVTSLSGQISLNRMAFGYGGAVPVQILQDISLDIAAGTTVAIVRRSGSGKTTLIKCLAGLYEPTGGSITYDGVDMMSLDYGQLRRQIGFVLQENHMFDDTIARNIAFGETEPDKDQVIWAAQIASAHEFIQRLPLGYETKIGESGLLLSGGQRQRIAIARAVYHRPPVLIFDEATSSLDTESERSVQTGMERMLAGRTSLIIAHRLSTVRNADKIVVLEQGRIVETGNHDQLMALEGLYYYLVSQQLQG